MEKVVEFRRRRSGNRKRFEVPVEVEGDLYPDVQLRSLIDEWIVPKFVEAWIDQPRRIPKTIATDDNGEHK